MKITVEFGKKEIGCMIEQSIVMMSESDMSPLDKLEQTLGIDKAFTDTYKIKSDAYEINWAEGKAEIDISEKLFCKFLKKTTFVIIGLKSVIEAIIKMIKTWAANLVGTYSDLEEDIGETKVWVNGKELGAEEEESECEDIESETEDAPAEEGDDASKLAEESDITKSEAIEGEPNPEAEIKTEFDC